MKRIASLLGLLGMLSLSACFDGGNDGTGMGSNSNPAGGASTAQSNFTSQVEQIAASAPDNTEPVSIDNIQADAPDNTEPVALR